MTLAERTITAAIALGLAATVPTPAVHGPRYVWHVGQDAGTPDASTAGDAGQTDAQRTAAMVEALRAYEAAHERRKESESK